MIIFTRNSLRGKLDNLIGALYGLNIFLLCMPYFMWKLQIVSFFLTLINAGISFLYVKRFKAYEISVILPLFFFLLVISILFRISSLVPIIIGFAVFTILLIREDKILYFLRWFKLFFVISLGISLITYFFLVFTPVTLSYNLIPPLNKLKEAYYYQYPFLVSLRPIDFGFLNIQFYGMFDEPGVVGTFSFLLLFADKYSLKSLQNIIIFIAGILSFSFYFYLSSLVILFYLSSNKLRIAYVIIVVLMVFFTHDNPILNTLVWKRFAIEDNWIAGDNRTSMGLDAAYKKFLTSDDLLWGKGPEYAYAKGAGASSYKLTILDRGLLYFLLVCITFALYAFIKTGNFRYFIGYLFLFLGLIYQRPGFAQTHIFFLLIACLYSIRQVGIFERKDNVFSDNQMLVTK